MIMISIITFVNVAEEVVFGFDPALDFLQQIHTASAYASATQVTVTRGRTVRYQEVRLLRDLPPLLGTLLTALEIVPPTTKLRLPAR